MTAPDKDVPPPKPPKHDDPPGDSEDDGVPGDSTMLDPDFLYGRTRRSIMTALAFSVYVPPTPGPPCPASADECGSSGSL